MADFVYEGKSYDLRYTIEQLRMYEGAGHPPILVDIYSTNGVLGIAPTLDLVAYGLCLQDSGEHINPEEGLFIATQLVQEVGYGPCLEKIMKALRRDCGFLFVQAETN